MRNIVLWCAVVLLLPACTAQKRVAQPELNTLDYLAVGVVQDSLSIADKSWVELFDDPILEGFI